MKRVRSQIRIRKRYSIPLWHCECLSYLQSENTLTTHLSLLPGGMDISLNRTIVLLLCIFIFIVSLCFCGLVLAFIGIMGFWYRLTSRCPFNMDLPSTETIVYCHLDCRVLAGRYGGRVLTNRDFALLNHKDFLSTTHGHGKLFGESLS